MRTVKFAPIITLTALLACFIFLQDSVAQGYGERDYSYEPLLSGSSIYLETGLERLAQEHQALKILLGWGVLNVLAGSALAIGEKHRDFGIMTAGWGAVNAGIATFALLGSDMYTALTSYETIVQDEQLFNRILAVNTGLNAGYMGIGFSMNYLGNSSRTRQYGTAVMAQGAFLMAFDIWLLTSSNGRLKELSAIPSSFHAVLPNGTTELIHGLTISFSF